MLSTEEMFQLLDYLGEHWNGEIIKISWSFLRLFFLPVSLVRSAVALQSLADFHVDKEQAEIIKALKSLYFMMNEDG